MIDRFRTYLEGPDYQHDLRAVHQIWSGSEVPGTAGIFMFLSYLTIPALTAVQPCAGPSRVSSMKLGLESEREKRFLLRLLGLSQESDWMGGISNRKVRDMTVSLAHQHSQFAGMRRDYMVYFAGIIALSALRVYAIRGISIQPDIVAGYWSYMRHALSLLGITLTTPSEVRRNCLRFIGEYTHADAPGRMLLGTLLAAYPRYVDRALPVLFPRTHAVVSLMLEQLHDQNT
jgi:hypothetical protein